MQNTFHDDLRYGKKYEYKLLDLLGDWDEAEIGTDKDEDTDYDVKIIKDNTATTYEVKADRYGLKTGNFCIEYQHRNKPSGILKSKADFYAIFLVDGSIEELYLIPLDVLKSSLEGNYFKSRLLGYMKQSTCLMIPVDVFREYRVN
jgi:hypothetical protein